MLLRFRLNPRFGPCEARTRRLTIAAHLEPWRAGREPPVHLELSRLGRKERAEDADRSIAHAGGHRQDERLDAVVPGEDDALGVRGDRLGDRRARIAAALEF